MQFIANALMEQQAGAKEYGQFMIDFLTNGMHDIGIGLRVR